MLRRRHVVRGVSKGPFDAPTLAALYPDRAAYSRDVRRIVDDLVKQQIVLKKDAATLVQRAEAAPPK